MTDRPMTDTPDRSELRRDFHEVVDSQVRLGHAMTLVPTDALAGLLAMADALDSRDARIASLVDLFDRATMPADDSTPLYDYLAADARAIVDAARAALGSASGTDDDPRKGGSDDAR